MSAVARRPKTVDGASQVTAPSAATLIALLGGASTRVVTLSRDEYDALVDLYGFIKEPPNEKPPAPEAPDPAAFTSRYDYERAVDKHKVALKTHDAWTDPRAFLQAGADRNMMRAAEADGLRMVAWIARHLSPGDDPVRLLVQLAIEAGYDVDPSDVSWAVDDDETEEE